MKVEKSPSGYPLNWDTERGAGANIGPNETLKFKVELIRIVPEEE